jgi:serine/threonine-protein kinase RsbT
MKLLTILLERETDVVFARRRARAVAEFLGFDRQDQTRIATGVSEIARNALEYAKAGRMDVAIRGSSAPQELEIQISDKGPGIADVARALADGYTTGSGLGLGLGGAKRLSNEFEISSVPGQGTRVRITRWL